MANIKRKTKKEKAGASLYDLEGDILKVREYVDSLIKEYGESASLHLDWYYDDVSLYIEYDRIETEAEAKKRVEAARKARERRKAQKLKKEEQERALLAKLKEKYE